MKATKGKVKLTFLDNGNATATLGLLDAAGLPSSLPTGSTISPIPWVSSDANLIVTPAADGMSANLAPAVPPVLVTGATVTAGPATITNADGSTVVLAAVSTELLNIVTGGPAGFKISVA